MNRRALERHLRLHRDVFRLYQILDPAPLRDTIPVVSADMHRFLVEARGETINLKSLGITNTSLDEVLGQLGKI